MHTVKVEREATKSAFADEEPTKETLAEREALGPELKAALDATWEKNLEALRYLADR